MKFTYPCLTPKQATNRSVFGFCAPASEILKFAAIDRAGRSSDGTLNGFQRPTIAKHVAEIKAYLAKEQAILPNSVVVAFTGGVTLTPGDSQVGQVEIETGHDPIGYVVDGQQRLTALDALPDKPFEVFVTGLLCENSEDLREQFILINNSRPLPKALIYELLPSVKGLPHRLSSRSKAAEIVERLNFDDRSNLRGEIIQHTNPKGIIKDTALQRMIMTSLSDGVLRATIRSTNGMDKSWRLVSNFFGAVKTCFPEAWYNQTPRTSRLVHGAGIVSLGYVMEYLATHTGAATEEQFLDGLLLLRGRTHWQTGSWDFGGGNIRPWNSIQNINRDWLELAHYLIRVLKQSSEAHSAAG